MKDHSGAHEKCEEEGTAVVDCCEQPEQVVVD